MNTATTSQTGCFGEHQQGLGIALPGGAGPAPPSAAKVSMRSRGKLRSSTPGGVQMSLCVNWEQLEWSHIPPPTWGTR